MNKTLLAVVKTDNCLYSYFDVKMKIYQYIIFEKKFADD